MNRVVITLNHNGELSGICADEPVEIFINCPHVPRDRVYQYGSAEFGPQHVRAAIGGYPVGHIADGTANIAPADGSGKRPPSTPKLRPVA